MKKFKDLITRQASGAKEDISPVSDTPSVPSPPSTPVEVVAKTKDEREFPNDPTTEAEVIASIEEYYFRDDSFDSSKYELEKIPDLLDQIQLSTIDEDRNRLRRQLQAVTKKMSDVILENQASYSKELRRVTELQECLENASIICRDGRSELHTSMQGFTVASLGIMAKHKKKLQLLNLLKSLHTIKTLQRTDIRLREMLEEEDYPGAIQLCLECQSAVVTFRHYSCISELSSKLQDTLEMIEEQLDKALAKTCTDFDIKHYEKLQAAYRLLGKTETAMDQLHMHFTSSIHNIAFQIVLGYVQLVTGSTDSRFQKMQFKDLCSHVDLETYIPCLADLCKALWEVMKSYYKTMDWHQKQSMIDENTSSEEADGEDSIGSSINMLYIKQKLEHGLTRIWQDVQQKVKLYLQATDLSSVKYDDFIYVLDLVNRLIDIGKEFCGSASEGLHESIRTQSLSYFKNYHNSRMEELRMFMENEGWEVCPVKSNFTVLNLHEFRFLRPTSNTKDSQVPNSPSSPTLGSVRGFFEKFSEKGSPFDKQLEDDNEDTGILNGPNDEGMGFDDSDDEDEVPEELKQDFIDEQTGEGPQRGFGKKKNMETMYSKGPTLCNTTIKVLRLYGKYMQMISVLKPIAFDVVLCMSELFDYYLFSIYSFFASDVSDGAALGLNSKLWTTLKRISDNISQQLKSSGTMANPMQVPENTGFPRVSPIVQLSGIDHIHGLAERIVGTESLVFLAEQLEFLQPHLEAVIPSSKKPFLLQFYSQTVSVASELRRPVYRGVASRSINLERIPQMMMTVRWDIKDIMSQHSMYVDHMLQIFYEFNTRLEGVSRRVRIPAEAYKIIWEHVIKLANRNMVEGFSNAKKCSNEGRALMQLDFQQFLQKLESITQLRPIPDKEFVEAYIKAFYLNEVDMENWVKEHKEYTAKQLTGLINCAVATKRTRNRILNVIEEFEKSRPR